ncbi:hypothetical protein B0T20DRAFT_378770 [Sordaria brevicollis]|uniref:Uncharacterized protein n=1 Tax=Sordaria brevicollis TaxID=83679 RepID=A0AAE0PBE6_SORBR|nr:hypothetical protein B0T20DRAFT_378770 [Sordaria brevicollis]
MLSRLHLRRPPSTPSSPVPGQGSSLDLDTTSQTPTAPEGGRPQSAKSASSSHLPSTILSTTNPRPIPTIGDTGGGSVSAAASVSGVPLQMYRSAGSSASSQPSESHRSRTSKHLQGAQPPPPIDTSSAATRATLATRLSKISSFVTPTDNNGSGPFGKRPGAGKRMASEPATKAAAVTTPESAKSKKSIPFLKKHSVSNLWARRKTEKNPPDITPLSSAAEPTYDPRIRGTKVHDFSAPRPKRTTSQNENVVTSPVKGGSPSLEHATPKSQATELSTGSTLVGTATTTQPVGLGLGLGLCEGATLSPTLGVQQEAGGPSRGNSDARSIPQDSMPSPPLSHPSPDEQQSDAPRLPVQLRDDPVPVTGASSEVVSQDTLPGMTAGNKANASVRTARSRNLSKRSIRDSALSGIPKHMKSTSSRFSFDMMGSADEEKALEERHRQRQREKGGGATSALRQEHDSRFDDLEEEDFDYDAMMDDDGLEEPIPGVNADYDDDYGEEPIPGVNADYDEEPIPGTEDYAGLEEPIPGVNADYQELLPADDQDDDDDYDPETDPDNDQENFAGFEFQRSNKSSGPITPHSPVVASTPSNETEQAVASSVTEDTTPELPKYATMSEQVVGGPEQLPSPETIRAPITPEPIPIGMPPTEPTRREDDNELYFDNGLADELDFQGDGTHFDENLFDLDDTDQYGRPIPGAFARAAEQARARQLAQLAEANAAAAPGVDPVQSTTAGSMHALATGEDMSPTQLPQLPTQPIQQMSISGLDMAYQAALAEAAQRAAESGKFRRSSSPAVPEEPTVTSPTDSAQSQHDFAKQQIDDYDDDEDDDGFGGGNGLDDYEFDDEDIIAEANASALANDSDGWYGQEFGFYSAPLSQSGPSSLNRNPSQNSENENNPFQYSYGGYFGPAGSDGVFRSKSGRVVCREPTLTPITETSEYSNRNSIMSLNLPPSIDARNSTSLQSPTLAQLALMDDDEFDSINKLRKKTWAGAAGSVGGGSMLSSREGSPRQERRPDPMAQFQQQQQQGQMQMQVGEPGSPFAMTTGGHFGAGLTYDPKRSPYSAMLRPGSSGNEQGRSISPTLTNKIQAVTMPVSPGQSMPAQGMGLGLGLGMGMGIGMGMTQQQQQGQQQQQQQQASLLGPPVLMPVVGQQQVPASVPAVDMGVSSPLVEDEEEDEEQYHTSSQPSGISSQQQQHQNPPLQENSGVNGSTLARKSSLAGTGSQAGVTGVEQQEQKKKVVGWA